MPCLLALLLASASAGAQRTAADFLLTMPPETGMFVPSQSMQLLHEGINVTDAMGETVVPANVSDRMLQFKVGDKVNFDLALATAGRDSVLVVIETISRPQPDSRVTLYDTAWKPRSQQPELAPTLDEWLTKEGRRHRDEVERIMPFMMATATYDPQNQTLTFRHSMEQYLGRDSQQLLQYLNPAVTYRFKGGKFKK